MSGDQLGGSTEPGPQPPPSSSVAAPPPARTSTLPATRSFAWLRRFAKLWGFALFCVLIVYIFRDVVLPFLFAILVAYILAPLVDRLSRIRIGRRAFPRALAVIVLYLNILAALSLFFGYFIPKLSGDFARLFREAPQLFSRLNREWLPRAGAWVDTHFGPEAAAGEGNAVDSETPAPPRVQPAPPRPQPAVVVEPLPGGRYRIDLDTV